MATAAAAKEEEAPATRFAKDHLKAFVERIERLEEEKKTIADEAGVAAWAARLNAVLETCRADPTIRRIEYWGSRTDGTAGKG